MHPLRSLVQTIDLLDMLRFEEADDDRLVVEGADLPEGGDNLVWKAIEALGGDRPRLDIHLAKQIPVAAGLGGGSADAAAAMAAIGEMTRRPASSVAAAAPTVGADVPLFLVGGSLWMEGYGERIGPVAPLDGFAIGLVVPHFELSTADVYRRWDELGGPSGEERGDRSLPPGLRAEGPFRNDLLPAALDLEPPLGDVISDLSDRWGRPVWMSGSGPSLFAYFADEEEATDAAGAVAGPEWRAAHGAGLRRQGVASVRD
jgi:4-diphosphocytidyl-2-C-methyl-D-erythritol kinase